MKYVHKCKEICTQFKFCIAWSSAQGASPSLWRCSTLDWETIVRSWDLEKRLKTALFLNASWDFLWFKCNLPTVMWSSRSKFNWKLLPKDSFCEYCCEIQSNLCIWDLLEGHFFTKSFAYQVTASHTVLFAPVLDVSVKVLFYNYICADICACMLAMFPSP